MKSLLHSQFSKSIFFAAALLIFFVSKGSAALIVVRALEGEFEQEYRILEQDGKWRLDAPGKLWTIFYDSKTGVYTGLEHRDVHYWSFKWVDVQKAVQGSKHRFQRFSDMNIEGYASYDLTRPAPSTQEIESWRVQEVKKEGKWHDLESKFWVFSQNGKSTLQVQSISQTSLVEFMTKFIPIHQQIRQAAVRPMWSEWLDETLVVLKKENQFPVMVQWGESKDPIYWKVEKFEEKTKPDEKLFQIPNNYRLTLLEALRGIVEEAAP